MIREDLLAIFSAAVNAVKGANCVSSYLSKNPPFEVGKISLISIGKAAESMAQGVVDSFGARVEEGLVISKDGHFSDLLDARFVCIESSHPIPDQQSLNAGNALLSFCADIDPANNLVVCISGGASSLVEVLMPGFGLEQLQQLNREALASGQAIHQINQKRKQISRIKAGGLAKILANHKILALYISDVKGDDPAIIGSGMLAPESKSKNMSESIYPDTLVSDHYLPDIKHIIVANIDMAKQAASEKAKHLGYETCLHQQFFEGEVEDIAGYFVNTAVKLRKIIHIWGGESVVSLPQNSGKGGRNQQLALAMAIKITRHTAVTVLSAGTDGSDGVTDAAGAMVDVKTLERAKTHQLEPDKYLQQANANVFFQATGDLIKTGPTNTNVMDIVLAYSE